MKQLLCDAFGFQQTVTFYSGRRGAHLYVMDDRALSLSDEGRAAVTSFVSSRAIDPKTGRLKSSDLLIHPTFRKVYDTICEPAFVSKIVCSRASGGLVAVAPIGPR